MVNELNPDVISQASVLEEFKEYEEVKGIIGNIQNIFEDQIAVEMAIERFLYIIDLYQEQPHLLDPHLESLLTQLLDIIKNPKTPQAVIHLSFKLLYLITKTRGHKVIVRLMPHEVADLEPLLTLLNQQNPSDFQTWETRYMLLLWLSIVSMIPFDMSRLDSHARAEGKEGMKLTMDRIVDIGMKYLDVSDKSRDAAAYMLSRFFTRHDVREKKLASFLDSALTIMHKANTSTMQGTVSLLGIMNTMALLFKHGKREDLVLYAPTVLKIITDSELNLKNSTNTFVRKLAIKLTQRLGLTFLKARVASWRYKRGNRSLADNLAPEGASVMATDADDADEEYDIADEVEDVIEQLLTGLKDKDTVVRWSAAKGIGRMLGRLPKELADEVVGSVMDMFTISETDSAWHGACLALAELGRRGLLVPQRLPDVVPVILKALIYEDKRGNFSVGSHVRDAACYVCWAFARAYDPQEIQPHVNAISSALVVVSVFDREVNVRRAAAAAFQENVGRQGHFPHGIDILTTCDYFAVGNRNNCYLNLSVFVAQFPEYTKDLIDHLVNIKIMHWNKPVRELSSEALHNLTAIAVDYMATSVLPDLVAKATSMDLNLRHGAILAAAEVTHALAEISKKSSKNISDLIGSSTIQGLRDISQKLHEGKLFRGVGGELMREAVCCLIKKLSLSKMPYHSDSIIELWQELIDDCLHHLEPEIQAAAIESIPAFFSEYYKDSSGKAIPHKHENILTKYLAQLQSAVETTRQGYALAVGALPTFMVSGHFDKILQALIQASHITEEKKWAESRRDAVKAITSLCLTVGIQKDGSPSNTVCSQNIRQIYGALFNAMNDYTLDSRGDVGAWVREATMSGLHEITSMVITREPLLFSEDISRTMFCSVVQQASEKIDRTRAHAGHIFQQLLYHDPPLTFIPQRDKVQEIFPQSDIASINWAAPVDTFPRFTRLLAYPEYKYHVLLGLTVSVGGLTESLVKYSAASLFQYIYNIKSDSNNKAKIEEFSATLLKLFKDHQKIDRVTLPMFKMIDQLMARGFFTEFAEEKNHSFGIDLYTICKQEVAKSGDPQKILASIDVFCGMLQFQGDIRKKTILQLMIYLCHRYPIVRKTTANKLYEALVTFDELLNDEHLEEVMTILSVTQWDKPIPEVRPIRNNLCGMFGVAVPVTQKSTKQTSGDGDGAKTAS